MMKSVSAMALSALLSTSAFAQTTTPATPMTPPEKMAPGATTASPTSTAMTTDDSLASRLMNASIRSPSNDNIGDVSDLVIDKSGKVRGVIAGIGGFLGIGEHRVMLPYEQLQFNRDSNGSLFVVSQMTRDQLKALPAWRDLETRAK